MQYPVKTVDNLRARFHQGRKEDTVSRGKGKMLSGVLLKEKVVVSKINEKKKLEKISEQTASGWIKYG